MQENKYYYWLDWLRWISALLVVVGHCRCEVFETFVNLELASQSIATRVFYFCTLCSDEGVLVFFVLSGFLVGGRTMESLIQRKPLSIKSFAINRMTRIWLPMVFALILTVIMRLCIGEQPDYIKVLGNFFAVNSIFPGIGNELAILWTMPYIIWFYVLCAALILLCGKGNTVKHIASGIFILAISAVVLVKLQTALFLVVVFGIVAFYLSKFHLTKLLTWGSLLLFFAMALLTKFVRPSMAVEQSSSLATLLNLDMLKMIEGLAFAIVISQIVNFIPQKDQTKSLEKTATPWAKFSYSLYLTHLIVLYSLHGMGMPKFTVINTTTIAIYIGIIMLCIAFGYAAYWLVERHTGKIRNFMLR